MARKRTSRIYTRTRGGVTRYYADLRDFADVGGAREALIPEDGSTATTDPDIAAKLAAERLEELEERRRNKAILGIERTTTLKAYVAYHLEQKAQTEEIETSWLDMVQLHLDTAIEFFGSARDLASIGVFDVQKYSNWLAKRPNRRGGTLGASTRRQYLNSLSNLYRRAQAEGYVRPGFNPVASLMDKPRPKREEARWLEIHDAALLLEAARLYKGERSDALAGRQLYAIVATFLLTGGRQDEVLGLEVDDISFDRKTVTFRPNEWRRLKTSTSHRTVPLWPQLEEVLREYVFGGESPPSRLLFPSPRSRKEKMITDLRGALDTVAISVGWKPGEIRSKMFRHTYCSARLQTLDRGAPVSEFTVSREMGHGGVQLVRKVYGHLGTIRHRSEVVEYRIEQHVKELGDRMEVLRALEAAALG